MRILLTGASSFTGTWFAKALVEAGHQVTATLRQPIASYTGLRGKRVSLLGDWGVRIVEECAFGDGLFLGLLKDGIEVLCHHGAHVDNYKSLDFDLFKGLEKNAANLSTVLNVARDSGLRGVVLTGSVFEQDEGAGEAPLRAFSPYGLSKGLTWQVFRFWCGHYGLPLHKFVIPNPFGPYEEPRFCHYLVTHWIQGKTPSVNTPDYVRDNIHISLLAKAYARFVGQSPDLSGGRLAPSGYVESQGAFALRFSREIGERLGIPSPVSLGSQTDFPEPRVRINLDRVDPRSLDWTENEAWDELSDYYRKNLNP